MSRFYDVADDAKAAAEAAEKQREENGIRVLSVPEKNYKKIENAKNDISKLRKQERELLAKEKDTKERKAKIDAIRAEINEIAKQAVLEYEPQS